MSDIRVKRKLVVNPEEAEIVRQIYDYYITGMGGKAIAERLNHEGFQYRGKPWAKNRILDIIGDESYVGNTFSTRRTGRLTD